MTRNFNTRNFLTLGLALFLLLLDSQSSVANPSTTDPLKPLKTHGTIDKAAALAEQLYAKFYEWEKLCINSQEGAKAGRSVPHRELSRVFSEVYRATWYAQDLQVMGEPAGFDLERRFDDLRKEYRFFVGVVSQYRPKELEKLKKNIPSRDKALAKIGELKAAGKTVEAEQQCRALHLKQLPSIFYLDDVSAKNFENPVSVPHLQLLNDLRSQRRTMLRERMAPQLTSHREAIETLKSEAGRVAKEIAAGQTATLEEGKTGDAAAAVAYIGRLWGAASAAITRNVGKAWALNDGPPATTADAFSADLDLAEKHAVDGINQVLAALAAAPADKIAETYPQVLIELSRLDRRYSGLLGGKFLPSLDKVAGKDPQYGAMVKRYTAATIEPTRWMRRFASAQAKTLTQGYPTGTGLLDDELAAPAESIAPEMYPRPVRPTRILTPKQIGMHASWVADDAKGVLGQKVSEQATFRLAAAPVTITNQDFRHYSNVSSATVAIEAPLTEMRQGLLVDDTYLPLDYSAADAVGSANLMEFEMVGGTVKRLTLEGSVTRIATVPDAAHSLVLLNRLPTIDDNGDPRRQIMWRLDVTADWVSHRLFNAAVR